MTRRTRRRITVAVASAVLGVSSPLWVPPALSTLPAFRVRTLEVVGNRFVPAGDVKSLASIPEDASVWDDPGDWEARIRSHPLVRAARVTRAGFHTLRIRVSEAQPVGFIVTPALLPVDRDGAVLPLDPAVFGLDLPIVRGEPEVEGGLVESSRVRRLISLLGAFGDLRPSFVARISEIGLLPGGGVELVLVEGSPIARVRLPIANAGRAFLRVEAALSHSSAEDVTSADARFRGQVILASGETR